MDRLLRPEKLETLPEDPDAAKVFEYWFKTFESFLSAVTNVTDNEGAVNRLALLTNYLSPQTYAYISEATEYEEAVQLLHSSYQKKKNVTFARHVLMKRLQAQNESISQYVHALRGLAKECSFQAVSAEKYKNDMTRDAFINGLRSDTTRRRLLEEETLDLDTAIKKAEILEVAKQQTELYAKSLDKLNSDSTDRNRDSTDRLATTFVPNDKVSNSEENVSLTATTSHFKWKKKCFFCGGALHAGGRSNCPAKNRECYGCGKLGHYQKVCQNKNKRTISAVGTVNDDCKNSLAVLASAPCCLKPTVVTGFLKDVKLDCLLDSGASENFINKKVVDELRLKIFGAKTNLKHSQSKCL